MKVRLIKRKTIENYVQDNARSKSSFRIWLTNLKFADWNEPNDMLYTYGSADLLGNGSNRVVFDIGGNNYRMICNIFLVRQKHTYISSGLEHTQNTANYLEDENSTQLLFTEIRAWKH